MRRRRNRNWLSVAFGLAALTAAVAPVGTTATANAQVSTQPAEPDIVKFVIAAVAKARGQADPISFDANSKEVSNDPSNTFTREGSIHVDRSGTRLHALATSSYKDKQGISRQTTLAIVDTSAFTMWTIGTRLAEEYDYGSIETAPQDILERSDAFTGSDIREFGFGSGSETIGHFYSNSGKMLKWVAARDPSDGTFRLTGYFIDNSAPYVEYTIDPRKGCLVTSVVFKADDGTDGIIIKVNARQWGQKGIWYPSRASQATLASWYNPHKDGKPPAPNPVVDTLDVAYDNVVIGNMIADSEFQFAHYNLPPGLMLARRTTNNLIVTMTLVGDTFVPVDVLAKLRALRSLPTTTPSQKK
jgi:hypothetical protein